MYGQGKQGLDDGISMVKASRAFAMGKSLSNGEGPLQRGNSQCQ